MVPSSSSQRGHEVRERLLAAATELVPELGWGSVSTRLLAKRAGVAPGLVHYHFASVQAVLGEASARAVSGMAESLTERLASLNADDGIRMLLSSIEEYPAGHPTTLLVSEAYLASTRDEELREQLSGVLAEFRGILTAWLAQREVANPEGVAIAITALFDGLMLHRGLDPLTPAAALAPVVLRLLDRHTP